MTEEEQAMRDTADHDFLGNCWGVVCERCSDAVCDVCHQHEEPRGECDICPECPLCGPGYAEGAWR